MTIIWAALCASAATYGLLGSARPRRSHRTNRAQQDIAANQHNRLTFSEAALCLELMSALMGAGTSLRQAMRILGQQQPHLAPLAHAAKGLDYGLQWQEAWAPHAQGPGWEILVRELRFVYQSAAPSAGMLVAAAAQLRNHESFHIKERSQQLSSKLVLPTGLLSLPAFICWGILPAVIALFGQIQLM